MSRILIIGYGNPLRSDDGVGWIAAGRLAQTFQRTDVTVIARHQLTPELAEPISRAECVVFVDATEDGAPGEIGSFPVVPAPEISASFSHHFDPSTLLAYAKNLFGSYPTAFVVTVTGANFGYGYRLSSTVENAIPTLLNKVLRLAGITRAAGCTRDDTEPANSLSPTRNSPKTFGDRE